MMQTTGPMSITYNAVPYLFETTPYPEKDEHNVKRLEGCDKPFYHFTFASKQKQLILFAFEMEFEPFGKYETKQTRTIHIVFSKVCANIDFACFMSDEVRSPLYKHLGREKFMEENQFLFDLCHERYWGKQPPIHMWHNMRFHRATNAFNFGNKFAFAKTIPTIFDCGKIVNVFPAIDDMENQHMIPITLQSVVVLDNPQYDPKAVLPKPFKQRFAEENPKLFRKVNKLKDTKKKITKQHKM